MRFILFIVLVLGMVGNVQAKPETFRTTNFGSHAAVVGACSVVGVAVLRKLNVPSPYNELVSGVGCAAGLSIYKEVLKDPVLDWGDVSANFVGGAAVVVPLLYFDW